MDLGKPFFADVLKGCWGGDGETDEEDIGLGIGQRSQTVIIFLSGSIEKSESVRLITDPVRPMSAHVLRGICFKGFELRHRRGEKDRDKI